MPLKIVGLLFSVILDTSRDEVVWDREKVRRFAIMILFVLVCDRGCNVPF